MSSNDIFSLFQANANGLQELAKLTGERQAFVPVIAVAEPQELPPLRMPLDEPQPPLDAMDLFIPEPVAIKEAPKELPVAVKAEPERRLSLLERMGLVAPPRRRRRLAPIPGEAPGA